MPLFATAMSLSMMAAAVPGAQARPIKLTRAGSAASAVGPAAYFTGTVRIDAPFQGEAQARVGGATVSFEPGAYTVWHAHPLGQTLIVTAWRGFRPGGASTGTAPAAGGDDPYRHRRSGGRIAGNLAEAGVGEPVPLGVSGAVAADGARLRLTCGSATVFNRDERSGECSERACSRD